VPTRCARPRVSQHRRPSSPLATLVPIPERRRGRSGFRPEHVDLGNSKSDAVSYEALVEVVEYLGDEQLAHLRLGDEAILAKLPVELQLEEGRTMTFSVPLAKVLLFDVNTQQTVGTAA
jgi:ABC-type sugar transport system ATPase subunit